MSNEDVKASVARVRASLDAHREFDGYEADEDFDISSVDGLPLRASDIARLLSALESREKDAGWVSENFSRLPSGDYWCALACGHVAMGYKVGANFWDFASQDGMDCCDAAAIVAVKPVIVPTHPTQEQQHG